ncbi:hypothetical protein VTL71DRAFT_7370 [Oculimacula yallundae]
MSESFIK